MKNCEFCGSTVVQGSNEFGPFACPSCLDELADMQPLSSFVV